MRELDEIEIPFLSEAHGEPGLVTHALWMLGVGVMVGVVLVASLATAAIAVRASV